MNVLITEHTGKFFYKKCKDVCYQVQLSERVTELQSF